MTVQMTVQKTLPKILALCCAAALLPSAAFAQQVAPDPTSAAQEVDEEVVGSLEIGRAHV